MFFKSMSFESINKAKIDLKANIQIQCDLNKCLTNQRIVVVCITTRISEQSSTSTAVNGNQIRR